jgi:hypothetical protein
VSGGAAEIAAFFERSSLDEIVAWLLASFSGSDFHPLELADRPGATTQLQRGYERAQPRTQERLKQAVARAVGEWSPHAHGLGTLRALASLAAYVRAGRTIPALRTVLERVLLDGSARHANDPAWHHATGHVIAVLHGFAPHEEVEALFDRWLYEDTDPRYYGQFFIGLCACRPTGFTEFFPRFVEVAERNPGAMRLPYLMAALVRTMGLRALARALPLLDSPLQQQLMGWLTIGTDAPAEIVPDLEKGQCLVEKGVAPERRTYHSIPLPPKEVYRVMAAAVPNSVEMILETLMLDSPATSRAGATTWN